jgi:hypothetical protein
MNLGRIRRIGIALTAAYSVALHGLLLSFVPLSAAALTDSLSALCAYDDTGGTGHPVQHDIPCFAICAAMGHGIAGAVPPAVAEILARGLFAAVITPLVEWVVPNLAPIGPLAARGPPAI